VGGKGVNPRHVNWNFFFLKLVINFRRAQRDESLRIPSKDCVRGMMQTSQPSYWSLLGVCWTMVSVTLLHSISMQSHIWIRTDVLPFHLLF
jgi:hypothetical protein